MGKRSKRGLAAELKTRLCVRRVTVGTVLLTWLLSILACSQGYVSAVELTATAQAGGKPQAVVATQVAATMSQPSAEPPTVQATATPEGPPPALFETPVDLEPVEATPENTATQAVKTPSSTVTPGPSPTAKPPILYYAQAGDTLPALTVHFGVEPGTITSPDPISTEEFIRPNQLLLIPATLDVEKTEPKVVLIPDSEVVYSPSAVNFDIAAFVNEGGGYLSTYKEYMSTGWNSGAEVIKRVAIENSINPRLLLAVLEYQAHWVYGQPTTLAENDYPIGFIDMNRKGLYKQLSWTVEQLSIGYYGWQSGLVTSLEFSDGQSVRLWPRANAGTVGVAYLFSKLYKERQWSNAITSKDQGFTALYTKMYGNPWLRAQTVEPLFPPDFTQPVLELPYPAGESWSLSGGPHPAWGPNGALAAVDFAPPSISSGCVESSDWVTASAAGAIVRTGNGIVVLDLDGDGKEQTGWVLLYMHVSTKDRVKVGDWVGLDDRLGHPSCEGGQATGTHVHIARKYNGQWILADGPIPMVLSSWRVHAGQAPYKGTMTRDNLTVTACDCGSAESRVVRIVRK